MHNILFMALVSLSLGATLTADDSHPSLNHSSLNDDGRKWKIAFETKPGQPQSVKQFILEGQTVDNADELITVQTLPDIQLSPEDFFKLMLKQIQHNVPNGALDSKVISSSPDTLDAEWWLADQSENNQHEWIRVSKKGEVLTIIRYTTKNSGDHEKSQQVWEKIISESHL